MNRPLCLAPPQPGSLIAHLVIGGFVTVMAVACREPETFKSCPTYSPGPSLLRTLKPWSGNFAAPGSEDAVFRSRTSPILIVRTGAKLARRL